MNSYVKVKQRDITDCGAACIASVAAFHNLKLPVAKVRQLASTDKKGTNVLGIIEAAGKLGFDAKGVRGQLPSLFKIPKPAIAHVIVNRVLHHYVVIYKVTQQIIEVMDPADGQMHSYTHDEFKELWTGVLVILWPNQNFKPGNKKISVGARFWSLIYPHRSTVIQAIIGALFYTVIGLSTSIYVQKIVDHVLIDGNLNLLNLMSTFMVALLVVQIFIGTSKSVFTLRTGQAIDSTLILGYYRHLLKMPQQFFDTMRVGEITSRINDAVKIRSFVNDVLINITVSIFTLILAFALMFTYYWKLALVILLIVPFYLLIYWIVNKVNKKIERKLMEDSAKLESQLIESLSSINTVKSFGLEEHTNHKTETKFQAFLKTVFKSGINGIFSSNAAEFFSRLFTVILLWVGAGYVLNQEITPGELLSFYALAAYFTGPVSSLIGMNKVIQNAVIAADRLFEIMDMELEHGENKVKLQQEMIGDIEFKAVTFRYGSRGTVFQDLNLVIPKGKVTAIVGESGSGKSTLMSLLQNLYPLQQGNITIGDYDLKYIDIISLREIVSIVPQKIDLFSGNLIDNIALGDYEPDMKRIITICSALGIMGFIEELPEGFATYLGENGATLSGGQKQRVAIARALYRDPQILILDEATSSLDSASEQYVQKMTDLLKNQQKTIILIAHRLSSVINADKIIVLHKGTIAEEGNHDELLKNHGHYYNLWKLQFPIEHEHLSN